MKRSELIGTLLVLLTAIFSGFNIVANKYFIATIDPLVFTLTRALLIGLIFLIITLFVSKKTGKPFKQTSWKNLFLIGLIGGGIAFWMFFAGLKLTLAGRAAFLHKTLPIYATIFAVIFLKEKVSRRQFLALCCMLIGLLVMEITKLSPEIRMGDFLVLGATILWAVENTLSKKAMMDQESNWTVTFARMFFGSIVLFVIVILSGKMNLLYQLNIQQWLYILVSGFLLLMYVLTFYWGLKYINLSKASTILLLAPVLTLFFATNLLGEKATTTQLIGSVIILIGSYFVITSKSELRIIQS